MTQAWPPLLALLLAFAAAPAAAAPIRVDAAQAQRIGLTVAAVQPAGAVPLATLPGIVTPPPQGRVAVTAPFAGVVRQSLVMEGQTVSKGQRLAVVHSREVLSLSSDLARARARLGVARQAATRAETLAREGVIAGARAEEAAAALREAEVEVNEKSRLMRLANADSSNGLYTLTAPIAGRVVQARAATGAALDDTVAPFVIDAPGPAHVEAQVPARLIGVLRPGMRVQVGEGAEGRVLAVGSTVDASTRSATLRASIGGPAQVAGRTVSLVVLSDPPRGAVSAPSTAIVRLGAGSAIFEQTPQGYVARPVKVLGSAGGRTTFTGVAAGARVAVTGVSELKSLAAS
jgi:cobalt-zinc-cadmium efflux system membrane fusion protein